MPHYKDGTIAHVGDIVRGKTIGFPDPVVGIIIGITEGSDSCNCSVATGNLTTVGWTSPACGVGGGALVQFGIVNYATVSDLEKITAAERVSSETTPETSAPEEPTLPIGL